MSLDILHLHTEQRAGLLQVTNTGRAGQWSSAIFLTLHHSSCTRCAPAPPLLPTLCTPRPDTCRCADVSYSDIFCHTEYF